jgi:plastocyanin
MSGRSAASNILRKLIAGLAALACLALQPCFASPLLVKALQRDGKPLIGAVVLVEAEAPALPPAPPVRAIMDQVDLAFVPDVLVLPVNSSVQFPNSDVVRHQVYSFSSARQFQLPLYRGKPYPPVTFTQPGVVTLGCNIHDNMIAYIVVTAAPFFGRTASDGTWSANDVPAGRYRLRIWHPLLGESEDEGRVVQIGEQRADVEFRISRTLKPAPLTGRPHSWDY